MSNNSSMEGAENIYQVCVSVVGMASSSPETATGRQARREAQPGGRNAPAVAEFCGEVPISLEPSRARLDGTGVPAAKGL